jgi:hypothetical protein
MSNKAGAKEEQEKSDVTSENENLSRASEKPDTTIAFPSEHVPTFLIKSPSLVMNINDRLQFIRPVPDGFEFRHPGRPHSFRRVAVVAKLFGVTEPIYQNVNPSNQVKIWLSSDFSAPPQYTFNNRTTDLMVTVDRDLTITEDNSDPDLGRRFLHTRPGSESSQIERVLILDDQDRILFQNFRAREYTIAFFKTH